MKPVDLQEAIKTLEANPGLQKLVSDPVFMAAISAKAAGIAFRALRFLDDPKKLKAKRKR